MAAFAPFGVRSRREADALMNGQDYKTDSGDFGANMTPEMLQHLKLSCLFFALQADRTARVVHAENYEKMVRSFGPLAGSAEDLVNTVYTTFQTAGFFGFVDQTGAARQLAQERKVGLYIIRMGSQNNSFAITYIGKDKQFHNTRVERSLEKAAYVIGRHEFPSWTQVIDYMGKSGETRAASPRARTFWDQVRVFHQTGRTSEECIRESHPEDEAFEPNGKEDARIQAIASALESKYNFVGLQAGSSGAVRVVEPGTTIEMATLFELRVGTSIDKDIVQKPPPVDLVLALDCSNSMSGRRFQCALEAVRSVVDSLGPADTLSLIAFDSAVEVVFISETHHVSEQLHSRVRELKTRSGTNIGLALERAYEILAEHPDNEGRRCRRLFLLSDGHPTSGERSVQALIAMAQEANTVHLVQTSCFGIGDGFDEVLLQGIATSTGGQYFYAARPEEVQPAVERGLQAVRNLIGTACVVQVVPSGPAVSVVRISGTATAKDSLFIGDVSLRSFVQMMVILLVTVPENAERGSSLPVCSFECTFRPLSSDIDRPVIRAECTLMVAGADSTRRSNRTVEGFRMASDALEMRARMLELIDQNRMDEAMLAKRKELALLRDAATLRPDSELEIAFLRARKEFPTFRRLLSDEALRMELRKHVHYNLYADLRSNYSRI